MVYILELHRDNGKENGNYYSIVGVVANLEDPYRYIPYIPCIIQVL